MKQVMTYVNEKGYDVCLEGPVIIEGVQHYVKDRFVKCDASLNNRVWNVTEKSKLCEKCYDVNITILPTSVERSPNQLELFA